MVFLSPCRIQDLTPTGPHPTALLASTVSPAAELPTIKTVALILLCNKCPQYSE